MMNDLLLLDVEGDDGFGCSPYLIAKIHKIGFKNWRVSQFREAIENGALSKKTAGVTHRMFKEICYLVKAGSS